MGRMVHGTMAPLPSLQLFFGEWARDGQPAHLPDGVLGRLCPPSPLQSDRKGRLWRGVGRNEENENVWGSAGGDEAPYRVDP